VAIPQVAPTPPAATPDQPRKTPAGDNQGMHTLNLKDADIRVLIGTVSDITGKNFIIDPRRGKSTIEGDRPSEIYELFESVLRVRLRRRPSGACQDPAGPVAAGRSGSEENIGRLAGHA
jgi:type II secretory pathway component GspD/PulD (secretin)